MEVGSVIGSKYRLEAVLGRGGMGSVWRALHLGLNAPVAIKLMDPVVMKTSGMLARFHREAQAAAQLRSPHVVQIFDHGVDTDSGVPFIVMELLEGESLADRLTRVGTLTPRETSRIITEVCRALARAHDAGIVHRDLKPANLFLVANDDQEVTKVLDFGIAKQQLPAQGLDSMTHSGSILGTPLYMSPEQIKGGKLVDGRSDLWSLAVVACECLTGKRPFSADSIGALTLVICTEPVPLPSSLGPVPAGFDAWFERAAMRDADERYQSAREFAEELRHVCGQPDDMVWSEAPRVRSSQSSPEPRTPPQFGPRPPGTGPDGLPLAPTVDAKSDEHTGDALAKSSVERLRPSTPGLSRLNPLLAVAGVLAIAASVVALGRYLSASDAEQLRATPHSALPAPEDQQQAAPTIIPAENVPVIPPSAAAPAPSAPPTQKPATPVVPRKPIVATPPASVSASASAPTMAPSAAAPSNPDDELMRAIKSRR